MFSLCLAVETKTAHTSDTRTLLSLTLDGVESIKLNLNWLLQINQNGTL